MDKGMASLWARLSLVKKSIIVGSALLILNSVILTVFFCDIQETYQLKALEDEGTATAASIAEVSKYGVITRNSEILKSQLQGMLARNISRIKVVDDKGITISEAVRGLEPVSDSENLMTSALNASVPFKERLYKEDLRLMSIVVVQPIELQKKNRREEIGQTGEESGREERIGTVILYMNAQQVYKDLSKNKKAFFILAATVIVIGIPIIVAFIQIATRPLKQLVIATEKVAGGDLEYKVDVFENDTDEIRHLGHSFNSMLEKLRDIQEKLIMSERLAASSRLAADVAHEINNPLAIMKNYIYIMMKKGLKPDDPGQQTLAIIDREIDRIARIITQFNDLHRSSHIPLEEVDINEPLNEVISFCRGDFEENGISIDLRLDVDGKIMGNRDKLKQVFLNLLKNAREAMPHGGRVTIETGRDNSHVNISFKDTGMGIGRENINRIFDPFFSTKGIKGVGLGLAVSYGIIKSLNGDIKVKSDTGIGTTFKVTLPAI